MASFSYWFLLTRTINRPEVFAQRVLLGNTRRSMGLDFTMLMPHPLNIIDTWQLFIQVCASSIPVMLDFIAEYHAEEWR